MLLKILDNLLHVALQVICEGLLVLESSFTETVVKHDINAGLCSLLGTFVSLFGRSVGSGKNDLALSTGLVLRSRKIKLKVQVLLYSGVRITVTHCMRTSVRNLNLSEILRVVFQTPVCV